MLSSNDYKLRKSLVKILESMFIRAKDVLYTVPFEDKICFEVKRKNTKLKYHLKIEIVPFESRSNTQSQEERNGKAESV